MNRKITVVMVRITALVIVALIALSVIPQAMAFGAAGETDFDELLEAMYSGEISARHAMDALTGDYSLLDKNGDEYTLLSELLDRYAQMRNGVYTGEKPETQDDINIQITDFEGERADAIEKCASASQLVFNTAKVCFRVDKIEQLSEDAVELDVYEWVFIEYEDSGFTDISGFGFYHEMTFGGGEGWTLESDAYTDDSLSFMSSPSFEEPVVLQEQTNDIPVLTTAAPTTGLTFTYSVADVIAYADKYHSNYNPAYGNYSNNGGDCANFVSQCMYAGGMPMTSGWYWYSSSSLSSSWIGSTSLREYLKSTFTTVIDDPSESEVLAGNPVFYQKQSGVSSDKWAHSAICVGKNSAGTPIVNAHTNDKYHAAWTLGGSAGGWVNYSTVLIDGEMPEEEVKYTIGVYRVNTSSGVNMREGPSSSYARVGGVPNGAECTIKEINGIWGLTEYNSVEGWVCLDYFVVVGPLYVDVYLDAQGGTCSAASLSVAYGAPYGELPTPEKKGYSFAGWYNAQTDGELVTGETWMEVTEAHTLYASWIKTTMRSLWKVGFRQAVTELDGVVAGSAPVIYNESKTRTYIPFRSGAEVAQCTEITYTENSDSADTITLINMMNETIELAIGSTTAVITDSALNRREVTMNVAPMIYNGKTYLPARDLSELTGFIIEYRYTEDGEFFVFSASEMTEDEVVGFIDENKGLITY